jgi:hypothetical protein
VVGQQQPLGEGLQHAPAWHETSEKRHREVQEWIQGCCALHCWDMNKIGQFVESAHLGPDVSFVVACMPGIFAWYSLKELQYDFIVSLVPEQAAAATAAAATRRYLALSPRACPCAAACMPRCRSSILPYLAV